MSLDISLRLPGLAGDDGVPGRVEPFDGFRRTMTDAGFRGAARRRPARGG